MSSKTQSPSSSSATARQKAPRPASPEAAGAANTPAGELLQRARLGTLAPGDVLQLQRTMGNLAVQRLLADPSPSRPRPLSQARLTPGPSGGRYAQEAGRAAPPVMRQIDAPYRPFPGLIQRSKLDPPTEMSGIKLGDIQEVVKEFGEGKGTFLVKARDRAYVLKLSSENPRVEVLTAQFGRMLNVPMPAAIPIEYGEEDLDALPQALRTEKIQKKLQKVLNSARNRDEKPYVILTEFIQGTSLNRSMEVDEGVPIPEGQTSALKQRLQTAGKLNDFFITLGKVAAFDLIVGHTDRFDFDGIGYRGNRAKGNLGNMMLGQDNDLAAIDLDLGEPSLDKEEVGSLGSRFAPYLEALKSNKVDAIIKMVLLYVSEGEESEALTGELATIPEAPDLVRQGINLVLAQVKALKGEDLSEVMIAWSGISETYGDYLTHTLKALGAGEQ